MYTIYVDSKPVHTCNEWYEAHSLFTDVYGIDEWQGLPIYTSLGGKPIWGNTPEEQSEPEIQKRLRRLRQCYLKDETRSEEQRERDALAKLALLVAKRQTELAELKAKVAK